MLEGGGMRRYAITHKSGTLADIIAGAELMASSKEAEAKRKAGERILAISLFPGTHPELADSPHVIILRDLKRLKECPAARILYPNYAGTRKEYIHANLEERSANIFAVSSIKDYDTKEVIYRPAGRVAV